MASILQHQTPQKTTPEMSSTANPKLGLKMLAVAGFFGLISLWMNVSFGYSLGTDSTSRFAMAGEYLAFDLAKLIALGIIGYAWSHHNHVIAGVFAVVFVLTVGFSLISSQAFMAGKIASQEQAALQASDSYKDHRAAKARAQTKADDMAISSADVDAAKSRAAGLQRQQQAALKIYNGYASKEHYQSRASDAAAHLADIEQQLATQQAIVSRGSAYNGALSTLDRLDNKTSKGARSVANAGFFSVALALGLDPKTFIARLLLMMAIGGEIITTMCFYYAGSVRGTCTRSYTHDDMIQMHRQMIREESEKGAMQAHLSRSIAAIDPAPIAKDTKIENPEDIDSLPVQQKAIKKTIGGEYACAESGCDNMFLARTVWHKFCPNCRARKDSFLAKG
ncbi:MAG: hypothetical protein R8K20_02290 [Gallionellaceae bacterium]